MDREIATLPDLETPRTAGPPPPLNDRLREAAELLVDALLDHYLRERRARRAAEHEVPRDLTPKEAPSA